MMRTLLSKVPTQLVVALVTITALSASTIAAVIAFRLSNRVERVEIERGERKTVVIFADGATTPQKISPLSSAHK